MKTKITLLNRDAPEYRREMSVRTFCIILAAMLLITFACNIYSTSVVNAANGSGGNNTQQFNEYADNSEEWDKFDPEEVTLFGVKTMASYVDNGGDIDEVYKKLVNTSDIFAILCLMANQMAGKDYSFGELYKDKKTNQTGQAEILDLGTLSGDILKKTQKEIIEGNNETLDKVFATLSLVAVSIFFIMWLIFVFSNLVKDRMTIDTMLKCVISLVVGYIIVGNAKTFVVGFMQVANAINTSVLGNTTCEIGAGYDAFFQRQLDSAAMKSFNVVGGFRNFSIAGLINFADSKWFSMYFCVGFFSLLTLALPYVAFLNCLIAVLTALVKNMVECLVRIYTAPISLAVSAGEGFGGPSMTHWCKKTLSVALRPTVILIVVACGSSISKIFADVLGTGSAGFEIMPVIGLFMTYKVIKDLATNLQFDIA